MFGGFKDLSFFLYPKKLGNAVLSIQTSLRVIFVVVFCVVHNPPKKVDCYIEVIPLYPNHWDPL